MKFRGKQLLLVCLCLMVVAVRAHAQGATSSITGVVKDSEGGVIPGANVVVTNNATATKFEAITNTNGAFTVPALTAGVYTLSISLAGFKNAEITDVRVAPGGVPTVVNATLEVGTLAETITVTGARRTNGAKPSIGRSITNCAKWRRRTARSFSAR